MRIYSKILICILGVTFFFSTILSAKNKEVVVNVKMIDQSDKKGLLPYSKKRLLTISDFRGKPHQRTEGVAAAFTGIQMSLASLEDEDKIVVDVEIYIYLDQNKSWTKKEGKNEKVLKHEQKHFDITALQACDLVLLLQKRKFSANWNKEIKKIYNDSMIELEKQQNKYDKDTHHGTLDDFQEWYDQKIEIQLKSQNCF